MDLRTAVQRELPHERHARRLAAARHHDALDDHAVDSHVVETPRELVGRVVGATDRQTLVVRVERRLVGVHDDEAGADTRVLHGNLPLAGRLAADLSEVHLGHAVESAVEGSVDLPRLAVDREVEPTDRCGRELLARLKVRDHGRARAGTGRRGRHRSGAGCRAGGGRRSRGGRLKPLRTGSRVGVVGTGREEPHTGGNHRNEHGNSHGNPNFARHGNLQDPIGGGMSASAHPKILIFYHKII